MTVDANLPKELYKANMQLWMSMGLLLQEVRQHWLDLGDKAGSDAVEETRAKMDELASAADWQGLTNLPGTAVWRSVQKRMGDMQAYTETAMAEQTRFATGLQQAMMEWQQATTRAIAGAGPSMAFTQPMRGMMPDFTAFMSAFTPRSDSTAGKSTRKK